MHVFYYVNLQSLHICNIFSMQYKAITFIIKVGSNLVSGRGDDKA